MRPPMKIFWTEHSKIKMRQYGLSKQKLLNILRKPERKEKGIVDGTTAVMKTNKIFFKAKQITLKQAWQKPSTSWRRAPGEIWLMYRDTKDSPKGTGQVRKIISAWRYPGITKPGESIPIPQDILQELLNEENKIYGNK